MVNLLTLEDNNIKAMLREPGIVALLPCLASTQAQLESVQKGKKNCNRCRAEKQQIVTDALNQAKQCIRSLKGKPLNQLKSVMNAKQLRIVAKNSSGRRVKYTF